MEVNSEQSLWIILSITHLAPVLISSMVLWLMQATRRWVGVLGGGCPAAEGRGGGSDGASAPPPGQPEQCGANPEGTHGPWEGGTVPTGGGGGGGEWGGEPAHPPPPRPVRAARWSSPPALLGAELGFTHRSFIPESKVSGKAGRGPHHRPGGGGVHRSRSGLGRGGGGEGGRTTTTKTPTPRRGGRLPPPSCRPAQPTLRY